MSTDAGRLFWEQSSFGGSNYFNFWELQTKILHLPECTGYKKERIPGSRDLCIGEAVTWGPRKHGGLQAWWVVWLKTLPILLVFDTGNQILVLGSYLQRNFKL